MLSQRIRVFKSVAHHLSYSRAAEALSIQGVVWANVERQWATGTCDRGVMRERVQRFCLRGLGVTADVIAEVVSDNKSVNRNRTP